MFSRSVDLVGSEGMQRLQASSVAVVGLGGVGSHAAQALVRAGVGRLRVIDHDRLGETSLNRHAFARREDVDRPKAELTREFLLGIGTGAEIEARAEFFHVDTAAELLAPPLDLVIDAIDSLNPKLALLQHCTEQGLAVISCMGASSRTDPGRIQIADLGQTHSCPLARTVRQELRKRGITTGIPCVFSDQPAAPPLPPDEDDAVHGHGRPRRRQPSLSTLPGLFGYTAASLAIAQLAGLKTPGDADPER